MFPVYAHFVSTLVRKPRPSRNGNEPTDGARWKGCLRLGGEGRYRCPLPVQFLDKGSGRRRCHNQGALLRDLPYRPPFHQERLGHNHVPCCSRGKKLAQTNYISEDQQFECGDGNTNKLKDLSLCPGTRSSASWPASAAASASSRPATRWVWATTWTRAGPASGAGLVATSNGVDHRHGGAVTRGGFADAVVVNEAYVVRIPDSLPLDRAAPLLCAGVTVYSPMVRHGLNRPGKHLGLVGLGGLGHVAVKFGKAFGVKVTVISTSPDKRQEALDRLGADEFLVSRDAEQMKAAVGTMDGITDTVSAWHPITPLLQLLRPMGQIVVVGGPSRPVELPVAAIVPGGKGVVGSLVGSVRDCQAMLDFAGKHGIGAEVEVVKMDYVNTALERLEKNDVRYRFVIDVAGSLGSASC